MAKKTSVAGLSEMYIRSRPQNLALLSTENPPVFTHVADTNKKMMQKLRTYLATFMM